MMTQQENPAASQAAPAGHNVPSDAGASPAGDFFGDDAEGTGPHALLAQIARVRATAGAVYREGGITIYDIGAGWEGAMLARDPAVRQVENGRVLEEALADPAVETILIPRDAAINLTLLRRIAARHGMEKTVFFEGGQK